jgi:transposase InsO family protein
MAITDKQMRKIMSEYQKSGNIGVAALRADVDRKTASKYLKMEKGRERGKEERQWRTRKNPFEQSWSKVEEHLREAPELEAKALFEWLQEEEPGVYEPGQVRSFQRQVRRWRALNGAEKEVYFPQEHKPGVRMQTDFTSLNELGITIQGEPYPHMACHSVLTYSNWEWATLCQSESYVGLKQGVQAALWKLAHVPLEHWTDHSTAATHTVGRAEGSGRKYNHNYEALMKHFGIEPRTIQVGRPNENGDVESSNGKLKRRLKQHLLLRGSSDFASREEWRLFFERVLEKANAERRIRLAEELGVMKPLAVDLLPEYEVELVRVSNWSTIRMKGQSYSVPSRLIGENVRVHRYDEHLEVYYAGELQVKIPRQSGRGKVMMDYRHIIHWLVRKPGAFRDYRYHEQLFPTLVFRKAYDELNTACSPRVADREYVELLQLAAREGENLTELAIRQLQEEGKLPRLAAVLERLPKPETELPNLIPLPVDLQEYDTLLVAAAGEVPHE